MVLFMSRFILIFLLFGYATMTQASDFALFSSTIKPNTTLSQDQVFNGFGCTGKNISPALGWRHPPKGTKSFALTVFDPDAPGSGWWHWLVYNISVEVNALPEGAGDISGNRLPKGAMQGRTDFDSNAFGGACPPVGDQPHRYVFTLYALNTEKLIVPANANPTLINSMINAHQIGQASFTAYYGR